MDIKRMFQREVDDAAQKFKEALPTKKQQTPDKPERFPRHEIVGYDYLNVPAQRIFNKEYYEHCALFNLNRFVRNWYTPPFAQWEWEPELKARSDFSLVYPSLLTLIPGLARPHKWWADFFDPDLKDLHFDPEQKPELVIDYINFSIGSTFIQWGKLLVAAKGEFHLQDPFDQYVEESSMELTDINMGLQYKFNEHLIASARTLAWGTLFQLTLWKKWNLAELETCAEVQLSNPTSTALGDPLVSLGARSRVAPGLYLQAAFKQNVLHKGWDIFTKMDMHIKSWCCVSLGLVSVFTEQEGLKVLSPGIRFDIEL